MKLSEAIRTARGIRFSHAQKFAQHVVPEVVRPARIIWNQAIGALFVFLVAMGFSGVYRSLDPKTHAISNPLSFWLSLPFTLCMAYFAVSSFLKARRIGRRVR